jgi:hypothetical protein
MPENPNKAPTIDPKAWQRNKTTAWLEFIDRLSSWLWQDNEGAARWTLVLDDAERHGSTTHPPRTAAGIKSQVLHQSRLKYALVAAFGSIYKTIINAHPNTEALDASGNVVPFGTNLLRAIGAKIVPEDAEGVTHANLELQRQIWTFPGLTRGIEPLRGWCDRILLLFNDLGRLSNSDQNSAVCPQLDLLLTTYKTLNDPISWTRCLDRLKSEPAYIAAGPKVSLYVQHIDRFATQHVASQKLTGVRQASQKPTGVRQGGHFKAAYSAEALCWVCGSANHDPRQCKMLNSALADYKSKHLHGKGTSRGSPGSSRIARGGSFRGSSSRGNGRGGHQSHFKDRSFNKSYHKNNRPAGSKTSAPQHGAHAANLAMPPPPPYPTAPEQHFAFAAGHDEAIAVPPVMDAMIEAEDKQKETDVQQPKTEPIVGIKRHYNEEGQQPDIYDVYPNKKPRLMDAIDMNLTVTFSDTDSSDEKGMVPLEHYREEGTLPHLGWWAPLERVRQRKMLQVKDPFDDKGYLTMEAYEAVSLNIIAPAVYQLEFEDTEETHIITIPRDASMTDIKDHPSFWFLKQVLEFRWTNPYPSPRDPLYDEKRGEYALVAAKILDYANHRGHTISPSWTLAKDVPDQVILAMIAMIDKKPQYHAAILIHMAQLHIFYMAYIESMHPEINLQDLRQAEFKFISNGDKSLYPYRFHRYDGMITIDPNSQPDACKFTYVVDYETMDNWNTLVVPDDSSDDSDGDTYGTIDSYYSSDSDSDIEQEEVDDDDKPQRYSPTSPSYCP